MIEIPATITIVNSEGEEIPCQGYYYDDGRIKVGYNNEILMLDPTHYHPKHPTKLFVYDEENPRWSKFNIRSVKLDIKK